MDRTATVRTAILCGFTAVGFGVVITFIVSLFIAPPWDLGGVLIAVGVATFFAAFFAAFFSLRGRR